MVKRLNKWTEPVRRMEQSVVVRAIRNGLVNMIPVLIIGAFALILIYFPVDAYQKALATTVGSYFKKFFEFVNSATFGVLSLHMTYSISRSYMQLKADPDVVYGGATFASILSFFILAGVDLKGFGTGGSGMGPQSMFLAILAGLGASRLYLMCFRFFRNRRRTLFSAGADREFNRMLSTFAPIAIVAVVAALFNLVVVKAFGVDSFRHLLADLFNRLFSHGGTGFFKGFFFVLLASILWMFGIHGSDTLEGVMQTYFKPLADNAAAQEAVQNGGDFVITKEFFDCFVLMGGCGVTICLLIAILLFSRNRARRGLSLTAAFPMIFNINELMVFGLPIVFNPVMLVPFLLVPLVCYTTSYIAVSSGWVPMISQSVEWTTPIILGGYRATGSAAGAILQAVNVVLGVLIYWPFVRLLDRRTDDEANRNFSRFLDFFKKNEASFATRRIIDLSDVNGDFAKGLCAELRHDVERGKITMAYQPQFHYDGSCIGTEALLRWRHPRYGILYPPLVIKLAEDGGFLPALEETVVRQVLDDSPAVRKRFGEGVKISFNVTGTTVVTDRFMQFLRQLDAKEPFKGRNFCLEIAEQSAIAFDERTRAALKEIRKMGILLAIDDFSMGQTSIQYLKDDTFDIIKLDGSLVRGLSTHENCREIVSSIVRLSSSLHLTVLAEFVETEEQKETLHEIGCDIYQGWLYSPAVFLTEEK